MKKLVVQKDPDFTPAEVLQALDKCPYTAYRIAAETGLTVTSVANYLNGKAKPGSMSRHILADYLRLAEYKEYVDSIAPDSGVTPVPYDDFIMEKGYVPRVNPPARISGYRMPVEQETENRPQNLHDDNKAPYSVSQPSLFEEMDATKDEWMIRFAPLKRELEAAHQLIMAQRDTNDLLMKEISILRSALYK